MTRSELYMTYVETARDIAQGVVCLNDAGRKTLADEIAYAIDTAVNEATPAPPTQQRGEYTRNLAAILERLDPINTTNVWDLYAAHALGGVLASPLRQYLNSGEIARSVAKDADALLAERRKRMGQAGASSDNGGEPTEGKAST